MTSHHKPLRFGILTVSDSCYEKNAEDKSGEELTKFIETTKGAGIISKRECVPDEVIKIQNLLISWTNSDDLDVILTTGGTGFAPRDVTPEATKAILDKEAPGLLIAIITKSLEITKMAMLSRAASGVRKNTLILNLPGSAKGSVESLGIVIDQLCHAVDLIRNHLPNVTQTHQAMGACQGHQGHHHHDHQHRGHHHHDHQHQDHHHHDHQHHTHTKSTVDACNVAGRNRKSEYTPIDVTIAQGIILQHCTDPQVEKISLSNALGYILAEDVYANDPLPPFRASIKDGYALKVHENMKMSLLNVIGDFTAGDNPEDRVLTHENCVRISTGAPVPNEADAVVQVESTELVEKTADGCEEKTIRLLVQPVRGQDIRPIGSDIPMGRMVLQKGIRLGPAELGVLAAVGASWVSVFKKPVITILSTGNELEDPMQDKLTPGKIRDSNKTTLQAIFKEEGYETLDIGIAKDSPDEVYKKLLEGLEMADIVVSTGGVSMGERDYLKQVLLQDVKAEIHFGSVLMKPGKPTKFSTVIFNGKKKLIFGLPGNPVSATVTSLIFVIPACRKLSGWNNPVPGRIKAAVADNLPLDITRPEYHRGHVTWETGKEVPTVYSTGNQASSRLASCITANALVCLPQGTQELMEIKAGTTVECILLSHF